MKNSKLIRILKTFTPDELKNFEKFISSPYFNKGRNYIPFFKILRKQYPRFESTSLEKEKIYSKLYKDKQYNDTTIRSLTSNLTSLTEQFLAYNRFGADNAFRDYFMLYELRVRGLNDYFEYLSGEKVRNFEERKIESDNFIYQLILEQEVVNFKISNNKFPQSETSIRNLGESLLAFFLSLLTICLHYMDTFETLNNRETKNLLNKKFLPHFDYEGFIQSISSDGSKKAQFLKMNYYALKLLLEKDADDSYRQLKKLWIETKDQVADITRKNYYDYLGNYCIIKNREADSEYVREFFYISKIMLEDKLFLSHTNVLEIGTIRHIIKHGIKLEEFEWVENFLAQYSVNFSVDAKSSLIEYGKAQLSFAKGEFEKSLAHLLKTKLETVTMKMDIKELYIMIYYELNQIDSLLSAIDSYRHFLHNTESILDNLKLSAKNFVNHLKRLITVLEKSDKAELKILKNKIEAEIYLHNKQWLLTKINQAIKDLYRFTEF